MKPGKVSFDFLITRQEGSRWRFKINMEGTEPEPDDFIEIESSLLVTSTISFKMTNTDKTAAQFKAKFTSDSGTSFLTQPTNSQWSQRRASWPSSAARAPTSTCPLLQSNTARRRRAS